MNKVVKSLIMLNYFLRILIIIVYQNFFSNHRILIGEALFGGISHCYQAQNTYNLWKESTNTLSDWILNY